MSSVAIRIASFQERTGDSLKGIDDRANSYLRDYRGADIDDLIQDGSRDRLRDQRIVAVHTVSAAIRGNDDPAIPKGSKC